MFSKVRPVVRVREPGEACTLSWSVLDLVWTVEVRHVCQDGYGIRLSSCCELLVEACAATKLAQGSIQCKIQTELGITSSF